ncbi:UDP kinase [Lysinibacillus sp. 2017]|uniref:diacylglycerol kinase family protein n=1 Tax=unclassified Lysinibacillus TaxID=2636778 RepID=UPI000D526219|nr:MULTISPECIES: diacylglycerol kinase family protein [unclassified Lysinibacillus]AWE06804.1 UDP kinase [Lysinibacillus sp. 2017]TGN37266.1 diacylglycerol kinase family protein [Lysinibacillus sp. S2017]
MNARKFFRSFDYALQGIVTATKEQNLRFHILSAIIVIIAGAVTRLSITEWLIIIFVMALVIGAELINSAIERVVDLASPEIHPLAKEAKDIAAGAVLVFAMASVIIGLLIFLPKWF